MTIAHTRQGDVSGRTHATGVEFLGIPFAQPPVGPLRWRAPVAPESWTGVRACESVSAMSHQPPRVAAGPLAMLGDAAGEENEDCLYLNVYTPAVDGGRRPVMVWIHGGAFVRGTGGSPIYDGRALAARGDVVVVTVNYRLGALGFLNLDAVTGGKIPSTGNEGLLDQIAALEWVRDNVAEFGGDPDCVTIFGESAGGMSCGALLGAPAARGLFHRAIPQSGASSTAHTAERGARVAELLCGQLGIDPAKQADALLALDPVELVAAGNTLSLAGHREIGGMIFQPNLDGRVLPELPIDAVRGGRADAVDVLVGSTLDEWTLFAAMDPRSASMDDAALQKRIDATDPELVSVLGAYRETAPTAKPVELFVALQTDRIFRLPALRLAEALEARGNPAHVYGFHWASPAFGGRLGACHAIDIGFVFGGWNLNDGTRKFFGSGDAARGLADQTMDSWLAFARTGDPSAGALSDWAPYDRARRTTGLLDAKSELVHAPAETRRSAWDGFEDGATLGRI